MCMLRFLSRTDLGRGVNSSSLGFGVGLSVLCMPHREKGSATRGDRMTAPSSIGPPVGAKTRSRRGISSSLVKLKKCSIRDLSVRSVYHLISIVVSCELLLLVVVSLTAVKVEVLAQVRRNENYLIRKGAKIKR